MMIRFERLGRLTIPFSLLLAATASAQLPTLTVSGCGEVTAARDDRICVPVMLDTAGEQVASAGFVLGYDTQALRLPGGNMDVVAGSALTGGQAVSALVQEDGSGSVEVAVTPPIMIPIPVIADGELVQVCFTVQVPANDGCNPIAFAPGSLEMGDNLGQSLAVGSPTDGGILVTPGATTSTSTTSSTSTSATSTTSTSTSSSTSSSTSTSSTTTTVSTSSTTSSSTSSSTSTSSTTTTVSTSSTTSTSTTTTSTTSTSTSTSSTSSTTSSTSSTTATSSTTSTSTSLPGTSTTTSTSTSVTTMPPSSTTTSTTVPLTRVAGGGKAKTDCYVELALVGEPAVIKDRKVECQDGDPACDLDGDPCNASCRFGVALCLNDAKDVATCRPPYPPDALVKVITRKAATVLDVPPLDSVGCGVVSELDVPLRVRRGGRVVKPGRAKLKVVAVSPTRPKRDKDKVRLTCMPPPPGCSE